MRIVLRPSVYWVVIRLNEIPGNAPLPDAKQKIPIKHKQGRVHFLTCTSIKENKIGSVIKTGNTISPETRGRYLDREAGKYVSEGSLMIVGESE